MTRRRMVHRPCKAGAKILEQSSPLMNVYYFYLRSLSMIRRRPCRLNQEDDSVDNNNNQEGNRAQDRLLIAGAFEMTDGGRRSPQ